ncbi:MAG: FAD-binding protein [Verrucomicrobia bacterium]|jgi:glycolate oxidase|nr:FAD-binding protein [Verrucomicrobiota bacterium]MDA7506825.1 FAD-binding protein [Akkermansiaceae bacterium]MBT6166333.1 FAD-binding protein [Verrucomicrobiota bacterium]MBT7215664.1 FAD-binding protein [Verrucomicrobiota bacterium]MBT7970713.1 FAD-binding protein [Verrucomicrobiota bacterium]
MAEVLEEHGTDRWNFSHLPEVVVFAESRDDVVAVMKFANERGIPVTTRGAGVGYVGGCVPVEGGIALSVVRMNSVVEIMPEDGVVVTQPGVILRDLQVAVSELGWYYPPDPASLNECSIGGNLATNAGGPRCLKYGVTKNYVLGLEVVLASGEILHVGGRCHKNKTGFDLLHLFVGSEGMLGVITEATLRIIPHPQTRAMLTATFPEFVDAAGAVQAILNSGHLPSALEITDEFTLKAARAYLGEGSLRPGKAHLIVEIDGRAKAVASELKELEEVLNEVGALSSEFHADEEACEKVWQLRRDFSYSLRATGLTKLNEDIVVPRSKLVELAAFAAGLEKKTGIPVACFGHAGDGNIHTNLMVEDYDDPVVREKADSALDVLFTWVLENGGVITGEHGVGLAKKPWIKDALGEVAFAAHHTVKNAFDPKGILNPGKFLD